MSPALVVDNVTKHFHRSGSDVVALDSVSFRCEPSTRTAIIGRNGAGKSTLLRVIAGILAPTSGEVQRCERTASLIELGMSFHSDLTGRENLAIGMTLAGVGRSRRSATEKRIIEFSGLGDSVDRVTKHYSTGMVGRLASALAVHVQPDLLLVDEVLAVGDTTFQRRMLGAVDDLVRGGTAVVLVTHSPSLASVATDRAIWLSDGVLVDDGPTQAVLARYEAQLFGTTGFTSDRFVRLRNLAVEPAEVVPGAGVVVTCGVRILRSDRIVLRAEVRPVVGAEEPWMRSPDEPVEARHLNLLAATREIEVTPPLGDHEVVWRIDELPFGPTALEVAVVAYTGDGEMIDVVTEDLRITGPMLRPTFRLQVRESKSRPLT